MAFSAERFIDEMRPLFTLMGWKWSDDRMVRIYEEFMEGYDYYDLKGAIKRMESEEYFKYGKFKTAMDTVRAERMENEAHDERLKEERMIKRMLYGRHKVTCQNGGDCGDCGRNYCPIVDQDSMRAIMAIIDGSISVDDANKALAKRYRGIGFEEAK